MLWGHGGHSWGWFGIKESFTKKGHFAEVLLWVAIILKGDR